MLGQRANVVEAREGHLGLDHPELGQVAAGLGFFSAERRPEAVGLAHRGRGGLVVKLSGLREVSLVVEVIHLEQGRSALAGGGRKDGRIHQREAAVIEEVAAGLDDLVAHAQDRPLARGAQPEVAMVHQELDAVLLGRDRVGGFGRDTLQDLELGDVKLEAAGRALVSAHLARDAHGGLLRQVARLLEDFRGDSALHDDALDDPGAVAEERKQQLAALAQVVKPALDHDLLAGVLGNVPNLDDGQHGMDGEEPMKRSKGKG